MKCFFTALAMLCITGFPALARDYTTAGISGASGLTQVDTVLFDFDAKIDFQILFGEPVINAQMKWRIDPSQSQVEIPTFGSGEDPFITIPLYDLGSMAYDKVRLYNVKLQFQFSAPSGETIYTVQDVGDLDIGNGEKWSFNVPGSPDWPEVFYRSPVDTMEDARSFYSKEQAQGFFLNALKLEDVTIVAAEVSFHDLHEWYAEDTPEPEVVALKQAYATVAKGLKESFGLEVDLEKDFNHQPSYLDPLASGNRLREFQALADHLKKRLKRLSDLPESFTSKGDPAAYYEALSQADDIVRGTLHFNFDSPDLDPKDFVIANKKLQRRGSYAVRVIDGEDWVVNTANSDAKVHQLDSDERLIGASYLIHSFEASKAVCENNIVAIPLLDPGTMNQSHSIDLPCPVNGLDIRNIYFSNDDAEGHPFVMIQVKRSSYRKVTVNGSCRSCGRKTKRTWKLNEVDITDYRIEPDLSFLKTRDWTWRERGICPLTLCRK